MTVLEDRIEMAESGDELTLDMMFEWLEKMPVPEGYKAEIVGGHVFMTPERDTHWDIIADIYDQMRTKYPRRRLKSDVRIDYPGHLNGFVSDVTLLAEGAAQKARGGGAAKMSSSSPKWSRGKPRTTTTGRKRTRTPPPVCRST